MVQFDSFLKDFDGVLDQDCACLKSDSVTMSEQDGDDRNDLGSGFEAPSFVLKSTSSKAWSILSIELSLSTHFRVSSRHWNG